MTTPTVPPEALLIKERREQRPPFYSVRGLAAVVAAAGTKLSASGLAAIERGDYAARPHILAALAMELGIGPDELEDIGRRHGRDNALKAAAMMREHIRRRAEQEPAVAEVTSLPEAVVQAVVAGVDEIRATRGLSREQQDELIRVLVQSTISHVKDEMARLRVTLGILH